MARGGGQEGKKKVEKRYKKHAQRVGGPVTTRGGGLPPTLVSATANIIIYNFKTASVCVPSARNSPGVSPIELDVMTLTRQSFNTIHP